jgi:glutathionylspermidine synthase
VRLFEGWCQRRGMQTVLGSPFNLRPAADSGLTLFGRRCDLLLRHYKTDWWGERRPIWDDEAPFPDAEPLSGPLRLVLSALAARRCAVVNPFAAVLPQNKRAMAFLWEEQHRFDAGARAIIRDHVPETVRLERADRARLQAERTAWVLKSDYGCEGEEVVIGRDTDEAAWAECLQRALPGRWIAQRHFTARRDEEGLVANHGVFLIGGRAAGLYTRLSAGATDAAALSVPVEVIP